MKIDFTCMTNKKIGIFTDLHCGVEKDSTERLKETELCVDWIIKTFKKQKVDWIIFLGDWFDSRFSINSKSLNTGINCIDKLSKNFEKVFMILGNHDAYYKNTNEVNSVDFFEKIASNQNIKIISQEPYYVQLGTKTLGFYPWASEALLLDEEKKKTIEVCDYAFGHFEANGFLQPGGLSAGGRTDFKDLFNFGNYIFSGHYHINKLYKNLANKDNKLLMVGSPLQLNWSDFGLKKCIYVLDIFNNTLDEYKNTVNAIYNKVYYSKLENNEYTEKDLEKICANNYIKLVIDSKYEFNKIVKYSTLLKQYSLRQLEVEYLISLTSDLAAKSTVEISKAKSKTNLDYLIEFIEKIYPEVSKIDGDIQKPLLIDMMQTYYNKILNENQ